MNYFCAQCAKESGGSALHPVHDIAADLRDISREDIIRRVAEILESDKEREDYNERFALSNNLKRFINTNSQNGKSLLFKSCDIPNYLQNPVLQGKVLRGKFTLNLKWLLNEYRNSPVMSSDNTGANFLDIVEEAGGLPVYDSEIRFFFETIEGEHVLNYMTASNNDPFTTDDGKVMRGYLRACPHCGRHISRAVGRAEEIVVALAGSPRAGKTSCLTAIASSLISGRYRSYGFTMEAFDNDKSWADLREEIEWFDRGYAVRKTEVGLEAVPAYSFLVRYHDQKRVLTFVDMPGEFWQDGNGLTAEFFKQYSALYRNIDCIWFFISKLTAYDVDLGDGRQEWQQKMMLASAEDGKIIRQASAGNLNANLGALREFLNGYGVRFPPIAVILTKAEMDLGPTDAEYTEEYGLFPVAQGQIHSDNVVAANLKETDRLLKARKDSAGRVLSEKEYFIAANQVREFFRIQNPGALFAVEENCPYRSYISMAAYGHPAAERGGRTRDAASANSIEPVKATPYHEMLPLIWTLSIMGAIAIEHPCTWTWRAGLFGRRETDNHNVVVNSFRYKNLRKNSSDSTHSREEKNIERMRQDLGTNLLLMKGRTDGPQNFAVTLFDGKR